MIFELLPETIDIVGLDHITCEYQIVQIFRPVCRQFRHLTNEMLFWLGDSSASFSFQNCMEFMLPMMAA
jgi:hypothetical protein